MTLAAAYFPSRMREAMDMRGMSPASLAIATGLGRSTVSHLVNAWSGARLNSALSIADALGVSLDALCQPDPLEPSPARPRLHHRYPRGTLWHASIAILCEREGTTVVAGRVAVSVQSLCRMRRAPWPEPPLDLACSFANRLGQSLHALAMGAPAFVE